MRGFLCVCSVFLLSTTAAQCRRVLREAVEANEVAETESIVTDAPIQEVLEQIAEDHGNLSDLEKVINEFHANENLQNQSDWRTGTQFSQALVHMLENSELTDCSFVVGPDGQTETFKAHAVILAAASPVFEHALKNSSNFRIASWRPSDFRMLLKFIYSGGVCFSDFEEACTVLKLASSLKLSQAREAARSHVYTHMFPNRLWQAFQCAKRAGDEKLIASVAELIAERTSSAMKDPKFSDLTRDEVARLLERDDLTVDSEVDIFEAVMRWGYLQVVKTGQTPTPALIREKLGPEIIKNIRFLTMTGPEFSKVQVSSGILDYQEGLAVLLYINNPEGGVEMPHTLSSNLKRRGQETSSNATEALTFTTADLDDRCAGGSTSDNTSDIFDLYTTTVIKNQAPWDLHGVQIPKSMESRRDWRLKEHFDVQVLDGNNALVDSVTYNEIPTTITERRVRDESLDNHRVIKDDAIITVRFNKLVHIPKPRSDAERYKVKVVFHQKREYPKWVYSGEPLKLWEPMDDYFGYTTFNFGFLTIVQVPIEKTFVYSFIND